MPISGRPPERYDKIDELHAGPDVVGQILDQEFERAAEHAAGPFTSWTAWRAPVIPLRATSA